MIFSSLLTFNYVLFPEEKEQLRECSYKVVMLTPEALCKKKWRDVLLHYDRNKNGVSVSTIVVDEAHCFELRPGVDFKNFLLGVSRTRASKILGVRLKIWESSILKTL